MRARTQSIFGLGTDPEQLLELLGSKQMRVRNDLVNVIGGRLDQAPQVLCGGDHSGHQQIAHMLDKLRTIGANVVPLIEKLSDDS